jgi:hypothetical protein
MKLLKDQEKICRELGTKLGLSISLGNQAVILRARGELDEAMNLHKEEESIWRELQNPEGLASSLVNQGLVWVEKGKPYEGLLLAEEANQIASKHGLTRLVEKEIKPALDKIRSQLK